MLFLFGGIPDIYYSRFRERVGRELRDDYFTGVPLYATANSYALDEAYCGELIQTLVSFIEERPNCIVHGLSVILLRREWEKTPVERLFWPFALPKIVTVSGFISRSGEGAKRVANHYADEAISAARSARKTIRAMTSEFESRLRRTPLLLPVTHFGSAELDKLLNEAAVAARNSVNPTEAILEACKRFEHDFPFKKTGKKKGGFTNRKGVRFESPARDGFHGKRAEKPIAPHTEECFLNARTRLGGAFADGFHFDCSVNGGIYSGTFANCHKANDKYVGRPHLNVYPNGFIRD